MIEKILPLHCHLYFLFHLYAKEIKLKNKEYTFINICIIQAKHLIFSKI